MKLLIVSSCSSAKASAPANQLTKIDFENDAAGLALRHQQLAPQMTEAEALYDGLQHRRLMSGVRGCANDPSMHIDLRIVSAGYGLIKASRRIAPYDVTFEKMSKAAAIQWGQKIGIPKGFRALMSQQFDLGLVLLGSRYLEVCDIRSDLQLGGPTIFLTGSSTARRLEKILPNATFWRLTNLEAKRIGYPLVGLKGELTRRVLLGLRLGLLNDPPWPLDAILDLETALDASVGSHR
jgi:hypothetical protein